MREELEEIKKSNQALKLYCSGLSKQVKELREGAHWDQGMIVNLLRQMEEMEIQMDLQAQGSSQAPLMDLTVLDVLEFLLCPSVSVRSPVNGSLHLLLGLVGCSESVSDSGDGGRLIERCGGVGEELAECV